MRWGQWFGQQEGGGAARQGKDWGLGGGRAGSGEERAETGPTPPRSTKHGAGAPPVLADRGLVILVAGPVRAGRPRQRSYAG